MDSTTTETIPGVVRGLIVELKIPSHFAEGEEVEVSLRRAQPSQNTIANRKSAAGMLADLPEHDPILEQLNQERKTAVHREVGERVFCSIPILALHISNGLLAYRIASINIPVESPSRVLFLPSYMRGLIYTRSLNASSKLLKHLSKTKRRLLTLTKLVRKNLEGCVVSCDDRELLCHQMI